MNDDGGSVFHKRFVSAIFAYADQPTRKHQLAVGEEIDRIKEKAKYCNLALIPEFEICYNCFVVMHPEENYYSSECVDCGDILSCGRSFCNDQDVVICSGCGSCLCGKPSCTTGVDCAKCHQLLCMGCGLEPITACAKCNNE